MSILIRKFSDGAIIDERVLLSPPPTADDVRAEAQRRMMLAVGARSPEHLAVRISNAQREAGRLQAIRLGIPGVVEARNWTDAEAARAAALYAADQAIEAIRGASNALEAMDPIPDDYGDDGRWPSSSP